MEEEISDVLGFDSRYRFYLYLTSLVTSTAILSWEFRVQTPIGSRSSIRGYTTSWREAIVGGLEGVFQLLSLAASWNVSSTGGWINNTFWCYMFSLYLLRLLPPISFSHIRRTAFQHSFLLVAGAWAISVTTFPVDTRDLIFSSGLLVTLLFSRIPAAPDHDGRPDSTAEEHSPAMVGLLSFSWMDRTLLTPWKRGKLGVEDIPPLNKAESAARSIETYRRGSSSLLPSLVKHFGLELVTQGLLAALSGVLVFIPTILVGFVLQYMEDTSIASARQATHYVILIFIGTVLASTAEGYALWVGQKTGLRIKSIVTNEIYQKTLRLPLVPGSPEAGSASPTDTGAVMNFFTSDVTTIAASAARIHQLWASVPAQILTSITLLYLTLGPSALVGIALMAMMVPVNSLITQRFGAVQGQVMAATDTRLQSTTELIQNIRIIKLMAWESFFCQQISDKRAAELKILRSRYILWSVAATIWYTLPLLITFSSFFAYTAIAGNHLMPSLAFKSLSLFNLLKGPLDEFVGALTQIQTTLVSLKRLDEFLAIEETDKYDVLERGERSDSMGFVNATFAWPGRGSLAEGFMLRNLNLKFLPGRLNIIIGSTGSGKSSMLLALLGEMPIVSGQVRTAVVASHESPSKSESDLVDGVALCTQDPWMMNDSVQNNILFGRDFYEDRYKAIISACGLGPDLEIFREGDSTLVGEGGTALSGGQKQRVALARAVYSNARHVLLDDCLSSVDSHTAIWIFEKCIKGPFMKHRTCILVTHNINLAVPSADYVVKLHNGCIVAAGSTQQLSAAGHFPEFSHLGDHIGVTQLPSAEKSTEQAASNIVPVGMQQNEKKVGGAHVDKMANMEKQNEAPPQPVLLNYLIAMGGWLFWIRLIVFFVAQQAGSIMTNWWVRELSNAYAKINLYHTKRDVSQSLDDHLTPQLSYYFEVYVLFLLAYIFIGFMRLYTLSIGSLASSVRIHDGLLRSIGSATLRFFDDRNFGDIMNVFSSEMRVVDQDLAVLAIATLHFAGALAGITILIAITTPAFVIPGAFILAGYFIIGNFYVAASRELKTLESDRRSPLFQHLGESVSGILTIRAYGAERRYHTTALTRLDEYNQLSFVLEGAERWMVLRLNVMGAFVSLFAGLFAVTSTGQLSPGTIGLSLTYAIGFSEHVLWLIRYYSANIQNMTSLQRIQKYANLQERFREPIDGMTPPESWPSQGVVEYKKVSARYSASTEYVLRDLTFKIESRERVGIVGRTGAGKSSLVVTLLRGLEVEKGQIIVDGFDTSKVDLKKLRRKLAYVPQDPTLFEGSLRFNLDPFQEYTDEEIINSLEQVGLLDAADGLASDQSKFCDLSFTLSEKGSNVSQGQRQLICIARAFLKRSSIIIFDEATASVDLESEMKIQACMRKIGTTVITIAHRLGTIIDYDRVITLDTGIVKEHGHPWQLLQQQDGIFKSMCEADVAHKKLKERAYAAWQSNSSLGRMWGSAR
ncbi:P-loop containing nucleoside triphosphate hydrolase protein [Nemania abortiva]|nr:P-loop containing nucleoside triphosphate hydrolase protein [Nemania abortiva]